MATLREISAKKAKVQPHQIDYVLENAPLLAKIPFFPTTHGLKHAVEKLKDVGAASFLPMDAPVPEVGVGTTLKYLDLNILGFRMTAGIDKLKDLNWTFAKYTATNVPKVMAKTGMECEASLARVYKNYALNNGKAIDAGGTSAQTETIYAVRFVNGENCGLYDQNGFGQGAFFDTILLSGGNPYPNADGVTVKGADFKSYIGFELENPNTVSCIVNVEKGKLTAEMMDKLLLNVRAGFGGATYIICHPETALHIKNLKNSINRAVDQSVTEWGSFEIVTTYNFPKLEDKVTITENPNLDTTLAGDLKVYKEQFLTAQGFTEKQDITSKALDLGEGGMNSSIKIVGKVASKLTIAGTAGEITLQHADKENGDYTVLHKETIAIGAHNKDELLYEFVLPSKFKGWAKVSVKVPSGTTGTVDFYPRYIPR